MQPKSMFVVVKSDFGFATKPLSMFIPFNIDFGFAWQPNSMFNFMNTDLGCGRRGVLLATTIALSTTPSDGPPWSRPTSG